MLVFFLRDSHSRKFLNSRRLCINKNNKMKLRLDEFAFRQFDDPNYAGSKVGVTKEVFMEHVNKVLPEVKLIDG